MEKWFWVSVIKPLQLCKLNPGRKTVMDLSFGKPVLGSKFTFWAILSFFFFQISLYWGEKIGVMILGQYREPVDTWGQDSHPNSSKKAVLHNITVQDLVLVAEQKPATTDCSVISAGILSLGRQALMCLRCLPACQYYATFHTSFTGSNSFMLQRPKWMSSIYDLPLPSPPSQQCPSCSPWVPCSLSAAACAL